jgi:two-component system, OmpR family, response regulator AdeR
MQETGHNAKQPYRVLIIEDDTEVCKLICLNLQVMGYECHTSTDGRSGLNLFDEYQPHIVLLDLMMPGMSGEEVLAEIRQRSDVPVLIVSALIDGHAMELPHNVSGQISKPFNPARLTKQVQEQLRQRYET